MITIKFTVEGIPVPKGRARVTTRGGFARAYTPKKTADYAKIVSDAALVSMAGREPLEGALKFTCACYLPIPVSTSKANKAKMLSDDLHHIKRGDVDNYAKTCMDALNGIVYVDDCQIVSLTCTKQYSDFSRVEITISEVCR